MKKLFAILTTLFFATSAHAADTYKFDPNHTSILWSVNHFGFSSPSGKFTDVEGAIILDENSPQNSSVNVTIKMGSISSGLRNFDEHLKSKDFFNASKFPTAKFESIAVIKTGKDTANIRGKLTMLGITKIITLEVKLNKIGTNLLSQKKTVGFSAKTTLKRSDFGIIFGLPGIEDSVKISIEAEAELVASGDDVKESAYKTKSTTSEVKEWKIAQEDSSLEFSAVQNGSNIRGSFDKFNGKIIFDKNQLTKSSIAINIDTSSIALSFADASSILQSAAWLSVKAFPQATFTADKFTALSGSQSFLASGKLTIKGKTVPVALEFTLDKYSETAARATGKTIIKRSAFEIGDRDLKKANGVQDDVEIRFVISAVR